ncbi:MAG: DUF1778 domain-containing protein [Polynucleobacter sp.]|uniref:type II toxin-antitoxin system TacA family antitoxin n=1 Tax=Polynucleobacter sp. TaxID=2029855 RepID=UPI00271D4859|nr:DUF1778 domain-containing protein [Polynucleobacter sp.]MDO8714464.1 DUF1778 domain-containing protein [Polynucleobacter sp.]
MAKQHSQKRSKLERVNQINTAVHQITLSEQDAAMFMAMLENPPEPNAALVRAFARRKSLFENGQLISSIEIDKSV